MIGFLKKVHDFAVNTPDSPAVVDMNGERTVTYRELDKLSGQIAAYLKYSGLRSEDIVLISCPRGAEYIAARIGVMKAGAAWVCVEEMMGRERIDYIRKDSKAVIELDKARITEALSFEPMPFEEWADPSPHHLAFIIYTSGSTGNPKGAAHEYGVYDLLAEGTRPMAEDYLPVRFANIIPETYVGGIYITTGAFQLGAVIHELPLSLVKDPVRLLEYFEIHDINVTFMPPTLAKLLTGTGRLKLDALHVGGEIVSDIYSDDFEIKNIYGPTEFGFPACIFKLDKAYANTPIGWPLPGVKAVLTDEDGNINEKEGLFCVKLPWFRGYTDNTGSDDHILIGEESYYKTSDVARLDSNGYTILGRDDDMIKLNGNRIDPAEVETAIRRVTGCDFAAVYTASRGGISFLCACIPEEWVAFAYDLREKLKEYVPEYMIPSCYTGADKLPLNENGKVNRRVLREPDAKEIFAIYAPPGNETEERLLSVFAEVLGIKERIGADDNFFLLGGNSLKAMEVILRARIPALSVRTIYREQTVRKITLSIMNDHNEDGLPYSLSEELPLTDEQVYFASQQIKMPERTIYNLPLIISFLPDTDEKRLKEAAEEAFRAHPALFTGISYKDGEWRQRFLPVHDVLKDISILTETELDDMTERFVTPPVFDGRMLFKAELVRTGKRLVLLMDVSHIICDGISLRILAEDILKAYGGHRIERDMYPELLKEAILYRDSIKYKDDLRFFEGRYNEKYACLPIFDSSRMSDDEGAFVQSGVGDGAGYGSLWRDFSFDMDAVLEAAKRLYVSVSTLYMIAAARTLADYNGEDDVMLSWNYSGREDIRCLDAVGMLIKDLPVCFHFGGDVKLNKIVSDTSKQIGEAVIHGGISPFMRRDRELMCFIYQGALLADVENEIVLDIDSPDTRDRAAIEPLELNVWEDEAGAKFSIFYDTGLYLASSMERFADMYALNCSKLLEYIMKQVA